MVLLAVHWKVMAMVEEANRQRDSGYPLGHRGSLQQGVQPRQMCAEEQRKSTTMEIGVRSRSGLTSMDESY